ncbi:MAG TPA: matrixin family metalloprotease [Ohtaekwangia sp.]|uniref:matrixin family metalloprotease n=1 Tax=Ohtaekwangia sp. TaxID=2066019 RepID=UPI002F94E14A
MLPIRNILRSIRLFGYILLAASFVCGCARNADHITTIALQPYGSFDRKTANEIAEVLTHTYKARCVILKKKSLPQEAFINVKTPRYRADELLRILHDDKPDSIDYILGLTDSDISTTKRDSEGNIKEPAEKYTDWGVFGLGYRPGVSCVVSSFRLKEPRNRFYDRIFKVCIHEIGHNLGLDHCDNEGCVMADAAESIKTVDRVSSHLCVACRSKIHL